MKFVKFQMNLDKQAGVIAKNLLPFVNLVMSRHDRDLAISLLGFKNKQDYVVAFLKDRRHGEMLSIILLLLLVDNDSERKLIWDSIIFHDKVLERRLRSLCGIEDSALSAEELENIWELE